jgi:GNAT superfamily N-acetyltransferase
VLPQSVPAASGWPAEFAQDATLRDGTPIHLRPIRPDDQESLIAFHDRLSGQTAYQRFFNVVKHLPAAWAHFLVNVDYDRRLALVAEHGDGPDRTLVAVARYDCSGQADAAEIAFVVQDDWQGRGLGRILLNALLAAAEARGIRRFRASVLASNARMLGLLTHATDVYERHTQAGVTELLLTRRSR